MRPMSSWVWAPSPGAHHRQHPKENRVTLHLQPPTAMAPEEMTNFLVWFCSFSGLFWFESKVVLRYVTFSLCGWVHVGECSNSLSPWNLPWHLLPGICLILALGRSTSHIHCASPLLTFLLSPLRRHLAHSHFRTYACAIHLPFMLNSFRSSRAWQKH